MNDTFGIGAFFIVLIIIAQSIIGSYFTSKKFRYFNETSVAIILGIILSAISYYGFNYSVKLEKRLFVYIFLPAIVFSEGYSLKKKHFFNNMCYILIYGLLGTIITFCFLLVSLDFLCNNNLIKVEVGNEDMIDDPITRQSLVLSPKEIILFSSALSSKDSFIASAMVDHHTYPTLFHIIFGEGIINDATSLVLFESFETLIEEHQEDFDWGTIPSVFIILILSLLISIVSGAFFGVLCTLILKHFKFINNSVVNEILLIFLCSYSGYYIIEYCNLSGIISLLVSGFITGHYAFHNLSDKGKICANVTFQTISTGAENFLFAFVGFTTFSFYRNAWSFTLIGWIILILLASRLFQVFFMSSFFRLFFRKSPFLMGLREQTVLVFTGMSRGILGFILMDQIHSKESQDILNSTMIGVLIITTLFFGLINPILIDISLLPGISNHTTNSNHIEKNIEMESHKENLNQANKSIINIIKELDTDQEEQQLADHYSKKKMIISAVLNNNYDEMLFKSKLDFKFSRLNEKYIKPFLIRNYHQNIEEFIISNKYFREDKIQLVKPKGNNRASLFFTQSIKKMKTGIKSYSQRFQSQNYKFQS